MSRQRSVRFPLALVPALALLLAGVGCGPFGYLNKVPKDASKVVQQAQALEAEKYAPYEYWGAVAYLEQAQALMTYSEYERAFDYGVRARQLAEEAIKKSQKMESGQMKETIDDPNAVPPVKDEVADVAEDAGDGEASGQASIGGGR